MKMPTEPPVTAQAVDCSQVADWSRQVGWDIDYQQVGRGSFNSWFSVASCERLLLTNQFCNRETVIDGSPPPDMVAVVLPAGNSPLGVYEGTTLRPNDALVLLSGEGRCLRSPAGFRACTISIPRTTLEEAVGHFAHCEAATVFPKSQSFAFSPNRIRRMAATVCSLTSPQQGSLGQITTAELQDRLLQELANGVCQDRQDLKQHARRHERAEHVSKARDYIEAHLEQTILLSQIAACVGVSVRTLELAFRDLLGVTPTEYIRTRRLNRLRQQLLKEGRVIRTLTDMAMEQGLLHLGRFSRNYKDLFGELPSHTLARTRQ